MGGNGSGRNGKYTAADFIAAIPETGGIVSKIADKVGCAWNTAKKYIDTYPTVKAVYDAECERVLDDAESVILGEIENRDTQTAKWYLTMKGRHRGYAPKQVIEQEGSLEIVLKWDDNGPDDDNPA
jgi:hypothetical protein